MVRFSKGVGRIGGAPEGGHLSRAPATMNAEWLIKLTKYPGNVSIQRYCLNTYRHETVIDSTDFATLTIISTFAFNKYRSLI
jgi:hypothetical protein